MRTAGVENYGKSPPSILFLLSFTAFLSHLKIKRNMEFTENFHACPSPFSQFWVLTFSLFLFIAMPQLHGRGHGPTCEKSIRPLFPQLYETIIL